MLCQGHSQTSQLMRTCFRLGTGRAITSARRTSHRSRRGSRLRTAALKLTRDLRANGLLIDQLRNARNIESGMAPAAASLFDPEAIASEHTNYACCQRRVRHEARVSTREIWRQNAHVTDTSWSGAGSRAEKRLKEKHLALSWLMWSVKMLMKWEEKDGSSTTERASAENWETCASIWNYRVSFATSTHFWIRTP